MFNISLTRHTWTYPTFLIFVLDAVPLSDPQDTGILVSKMGMAVHLVQGSLLLLLVVVAKVGGLYVDVHVPVPGERLVTTRECAGECFVFRMASNVTFENVLPGERLITPNYGTFERPGLQVIKHVARPL